MENERRIKTSEIIFELMAMKKMSYRELSEKTEIAKSSLQRYVTNPKSKIPMENCLKIANALDTTISHLLGIDIDNSINEEMRIFPSSLAKFMDEKNIDLENLASYCDVDEQTVTNWLNGLEQPNINDIRNICRTFDISKSELFSIDQSLQHKITGYKIPVVGRVAAGLPLDAIEEVIDYEEISHAMAKTGEYFGLQIKGDSMEPRMLEGDVVIVRKQNTVESGDIAIVLVNGDDATCKKVKILNNGIMLMPLNTKYEPWEYNAEEIESKPVRIIGKVVELRGKF